MTPPPSTAPDALDDLRRVFAPCAVRTLAGGRSFDRGELYAASGRVRKLTVTATSVQATVQGTAPYRVRLWVEDSKPAFACSCPVGADGAFCKHCVAVALVAVQAVPADPVETSPAPDLRGYLQTVGHARLVDLILELSDNDEMLRARLQLDAARAATRPASLQHLKYAIDDVVVPADFVSWRESYTYATSIRTMLDTLGTMLREGHAEAVIELAEHALARLEDAVGHVDDSDGHLGDIAGELQALHLRACRAARPNPVALATRLFERERDAGDLGVFSGAAATYAPVLGRRGLAAYRRLAEAEWDRLPPLRHGDTSGDAARRLRITHMMESLAEATGDVDAVVAVLAKDQSSPWQLVRIAERLRKAGRHADALTWAERGLGTFGDTDPRLVEVVADEYHRAGRGADAVALAWRIFNGKPSPAAYRRLAAEAKKAGVWSGSRQRALDRLRGGVRRRMRAARGASVSPWAARADASDTVDVLLWEGEVEQAWSEATALGCSDRLWCELARRREGDHPLDAIPIWQAEVERSIEGRSNDAYRQAVELMAHVAKLMRAAGQPDAFPPYASGVRTRHRAKRNLVKLLDDRRW